MLKLRIIAVLTLAVLFNSAFSLSLSDSLTPAVYFWRPLSESDWQAPSSWSPARSTRAPSDILVFNTGGTTTATNVPAESIGQLIVSENTIVNLQSVTTVNLTIAAGDGEDLIVGAGSALNFTGANAITCNLASGATAKIDGAMTFSSSAAAGHRLMAFDADAIHFEKGAVFNAASGFVGNPFGTASLNSVIFGTGSTYISVAGADPFGATEPNSVVVFREGSLFCLRGDALPSFSGRTYANFELNNPGRDVWATGASPMVMDDLTVTAGRLYLNLSGDPGHSIKGNINLMPGTRLIFSSGTVRLNGAHTQTFRGASAAQQVDGGSTIVIDNPQGFTLSNYPFAAWNLVLVNGKVDAGKHYVVVGGDLSRTNGYVNGSLRRLFFSPGSYTYHLGTDNGYTPVTVDVVNAATYPSVIEIKATQTAQPNLLQPSKALSRYWEMYETGDITANLTFNYLDIDVLPTANESNFRIQKYNAGFTQPAGTIDTAANTFQVDQVTDFARDWTLAEPSALLPPRTNFDYDGDGKADESVFRPSSGAWYLLRSTTGFTGVSFGLSTDKIAPADFDGDGKTDVAVYRPSESTWYWMNSSNGTLSAVQFGVAEDLPTPADYDGDGRSDTSVFRPSNGVWYRLNSSNGSFTAVQFGASDDKPTIGDYDGDGHADIAVFRPSTGAWYRLNSSNGQFIGVSFGLSTDLITPADFDGDAKTDVAVYRPSAGTWFWLNSTNGNLTAVPFGTSEDLPVAADYDGDGRTDVSVFRPSNGVWYRLNSGNGSFFAVQFGTSTDRPTPAAFRY